MKRILNKIKTSLLPKLIFATFFLLFSFFSFAGYALALNCDDPSLPEYSSQECIKQKLGFDKINTSSVLIQRNPVDFIIIVFRVLLAIVIIVVVFRIVLAGIGIANAKEDAEKRQEGFTKVINAVIGLVIALSALGLTQLVQNVFGAKTSDVLIDCANIPNNADQAVKTRCRELIYGNGSGPAPVVTQPVCVDANGKPVKCPL